MTDIVVSGWHTDIWLEGFGDGWNDSFNSVLFGEVDD
jgi:hypothetical protein